MSSNKKKVVHVSGTYYPWAKSTVMAGIAIAISSAILRSLLDRTVFDVVVGYRGIRRLHTTETAMRRVFWLRCFYVIADTDYMVEIRIDKVAQPVSWKLREGAVLKNSAPYANIDVDPDTKWNDTEPTDKIELIGKLENRSHYNLNLRTQY